MNTAVSTSANVPNAFSWHRDRVEKHDLDVEQDESIAIR